MPRLKSGLSGAALGAALGAIVGAVMAVPAWPQVTGSTASIRVGSGPHKGEYAFAPTETCVIAAFGDRPSGLSVVLHSTEAVLSVDVPDVEKRASEIQVVLALPRELGLAASKMVSCAGKVVRVERHGTQYGIAAEIAHIEGIP